jgi:hypothetical protein
VKGKMVDQKKEIVPKTMLFKRIVAHSNHTPFFHAHLCSRTTPYWNSQQFRFASHTTAAAATIRSPSECAKWIEKDIAAFPGIARPDLAEKEPLVLLKVLSSDVNLEVLPNVHQMVYQAVREIYADETEGTQIEIEKVVNKRLERIRDLSKAEVSHLPSSL